MGIDFGVNMVFRQGFGQPWFRSSVRRPATYFGSSKTRAAQQRHQPNRLPSVTSFDIRVGKQFKIRRTTLNFDFDIFNLFNSGTVLGRRYRLPSDGATGFNQVLEIMNPRIARLGLRLGVIVYRNRPGIRVARGGLHADSSQCPQNSPEALVPIALPPPPSR